MGWQEINKLEYLSHSQVSMYRRCAKQYEYRYVKGLKRAPTSALILGSSVHKGIEKNYVSKFKTKKPAPLDDILDTFAQGFEDFKHGADFEGKDPGMVKDAGYEMTRVHYEKFAPTVQPMELPEKEFLITMPNVRKRIKGFIDVVAKQNGSKVVIDNKTSSRKKSEFDVHVDDQLTMYAYAEKQLTNVAPRYLAFDVLVHTKSGVTPQRVITHRDEERFKALEETVRLVDLGIKTGVFPPTSNAQTCSWCGYSDICPNAKAARAARDGHHED